jgi:thiol:disulfide interchange protein DsbD
LGFVDTLEAWGAGLNDSLGGALASGSPRAFLIVFLAGVATSLTPCVYPMMPVVVTYIGGSAAGSRSRAVVRSAVYVLGMVLVYAGLGWLAGYFGLMFGAITQKWYTYGAVGLIIIALGLSMLGLWNISLPGPLQAKLAAGRTKRGLLGPLLMGAASGFIAAPCTAPVLGTLLFLVGQGGQPVYGALLLADFALGMGLLLFLLGAFSGLLAGLPRAGKWTEVVKYVFGALMIVVGCWFLYQGWKLL